MTNYFVELQRALYDVVICARRNRIMERAVTMRYVVFEFRSQVGPEYALIRRILMLQYLRS